MANSRFYDEVMLSPHVEAKDLLHGAVVVVGTNVSDYYFEGSDQEYWSLQHDFINIAPPFEKCFIECDAPEQIVSEVHGITKWGKERASRWGCLLLARDQYAEPYTDEELAETVKQLVVDYKQACREVASLLGKEPQNEMEEAILRKYAMLSYEVQHLDTYAERQRQMIIDKKMRWVISAFAYVKNKNVAYGPVWYWQFTVHEDGAGMLIENGGGIINMPMGTIHKNVELVRLVDGERAAYEYMDETRRMIAFVLETALLTVTFMHCKGVTLEQHKQIPKPLSARQIRHKEKVRELCTYHVLVIEPFKRILKTVGKVQEVGLKQALHLVRGHFMTYTEERKMFGKYTGTYWVPLHMRGTREAGVVEKDYRIGKV